MEMMRFHKKTSTRYLAGNINYCWEKYMKPDKFVGAKIALGNCPSKISSL